MYVSAPQHMGSTCLTPTRRVPPGARPNGISSRLLCNNIHMRLLGEIVRLQVQTASLKPGERGQRWYDPSCLRVVPALDLEPDGVEGHGDDRFLVDVHNARHPQSKRRSENAISIGFTAHYERMQRQFGV